MGITQSRSVTMPDGYTYRVTRFFFRQPRGAVPAVDLGASVMPGGVQVAPVDVLRRKREGQRGPWEALLTPRQDGTWRANPKWSLRWPVDEPAWRRDGIPYQPVRLPRGGVKWLMGESIDGHYVADVPCNATCVEARGGKCDCSCGGKNHGAGVTMVWIPPDAAAGKVLKAMGYNPRALAEVVPPTW